MDHRKFVTSVVIGLIIMLRIMQAANLAGFRASEDPRFEAGIPDFMNGILNFSIHFNVVHRKVDWRNPQIKSLNSMPGMYSDVFYSAAIMISMLLSTLYWCLEAFIRRLMQQQ